MVRQSNVRFYPITIAATDNHLPHKQATHAAMKKLAHDLAAPTLLYPAHPG
jgi:hypothetical protein